MNTKTRVTIEDLYKVDGKAELVNREIVEMPPAGDDPGRASLLVQAVAENIGPGAKRHDPLAAAGVVIHGPTAFGPLPKAISTVFNHADSSLRSRRLPLHQEVV